MNSLQKLFNMWFKHVLMSLIIIFGPPATGKMTVGRKLAEMTGFKLLHNHISIELALQFFEHGSKGFKNLNEAFRRMIMEEVAISDLPGLIFTYVWDFYQDKDKAYVEKFCDIFRKQGREIYYVELFCELEERLKRNKSIDRISEKPSKQDILLSEQNLLRTEEKHIMNTDGNFYYDKNYIKINNTNLKAEEVAKKIRDEFELV